MWFSRLSLKLFLVYAALNVGMVIVKHLVQAFGGQVSVTNAVGKGSVFRVRLPRAERGAAA